jgi:hypothetical protein
MRGRRIGSGKHAGVEYRCRNSEETKMLNVSSVLISLAPMWAILLLASSAAAYFVFWRKVID